MSLEQARHVGEETSRISALSPGMSLASPEAAAANISKLSDIVERLSVLTPDKTPEAIAAAMEKTLQGSPRGLRAVGIDPKDLAVIAGVRDKALQSDQQLLLKTLDTYARQRVPDATLRERGNLPSIQIQKIRDDFATAMEKIGDAGLFDKVAAKLRSTGRTLVRLRSKSRMGGACGGHQQKRRGDF